MQFLDDISDQLHHTTLLVRCNFDVPMENNQVVDSTRIEATIPTIKLLLQNDNQLILIAHAGRPEGKFIPSDSLSPVATVLSNLLNQSVQLIPYQKDYHQLRPFSEGSIQLLDNIRFYSEEEANNREFANYLSSLGTAYVNEAFANCHRAHASMVLLPELFPGHSFAGLSLAQEIHAMEKVTHNPAKPFVVIIGGAKLETKEPLVTALAPKADYILVGGKIAYDIQTLPHLPQNIMIAQLTPDGKDITLESAQRFASLIREAKTVIWNGTMGVFENLEHRQGTTIIAQAINQTAAFTLVGGGDTETALTELNLETGIDHISTGGGAMLTYLSEGKLVALEALH